MTGDYCLWNDDCMKILPLLEDRRINMILCDLPFGITANSWDSVLDLTELWKQYKRIIKPEGVVALFAVQPFATDLINSNRDWFKYDLVWNKNVPTGMSYAKYRPMRYHENILIFCEGKGTFNKQMKDRVGENKECYNYYHYCGKNNHVQVEKIKKKYDPNFVNPSTVLNFNVVPNRKGKLHPTQKPVELCEYLIKTYSNAGELVVDNCMGSGTTGVAALNTGRKFFGIEKEEDYFKIASERIREVNNG